MSAISVPTVEFVVDIINDTLHELYDVSGQNSAFQLVHKSKTSSIQYHTPYQLKKEMKDRLLRKSIHKGKFLGFNINGNFLPFEDVVISRLPSNTEIQLVIEHEFLSLIRMEELIESKKKKLIEIGGLTDTLTARLIKDFCWSSDAIEGTTVERDEARVFLSDPKDIEGEDKIELFNHFETVNKLVLPMQDKPITDIDEKYMKALHLGLDIVNMTSERKGTYRNNKVIIRGRPDPMFTDHNLLATECKKMFETLHNMTKESILFKAGWLHCQFIKHHPFFDGNGRVGRMLMITVLLQGGYPIPCIQPGIREIYFHSLAMSQRWEMDVVSGKKLKEGIAAPYDFLLRIILEALCRSLDICISMINR